MAKKSNTNKNIAYIFGAIILVVAFYTWQGSEQKKASIPKLEQSSEELQKRYFKHLPEALADAFSQIKADKCKSAEDREMCAVFGRIFTFPEGPVKRFGQVYLFLNNHRDLMKELLQDDFMQTDKLDFEKKAFLKLLSRAEPRKFFDIHRVQNYHIFLFENTDNNYKMTGYLWLSDAAVSAFHQNQPLQNIPHEWVEPD